MVDLVTLLPVFEYIAPFAVFSHEEQCLIAELAYIQQHKAGEFLLRPGDVCDTGGFILSGVMRRYVINEEGNEQIRAFKHSGDFIMDLDSYLLQRPCTEYRELLSDASIIYWKREDINYLRRNLNNWDEIYTKVICSILLFQESTRSEMLVDDASIRYQKFVERHTEVVRVAPQRMIANYLGITPQSLSRIRNQNNYGTQKR
jgi:CRP-like cAMP-binding protein